MNFTSKKKWILPQREKEIPKDYSHYLHGFPGALGTSEEEPVSAEGLLQPFPSLNSIGFCLLYCCFLSFQTKSVSEVGFQRRCDVVERIWTLEIAGTLGLSLCPMIHWLCDSGQGSDLPVFVFVLFFFLNCMQKSMKPTPQGYLEDYIRSHQPKCISHSQAQHRCSIHSDFLFFLPLLFIDPPQNGSFISPPSSHFKS